MHTSRKPTQIQRLRRTLGFGSAFTSVLKRLLIRLAFFIRPATDQKMCACPSAFAGTTSEALAALPTIPQPCGYPIDGQLNPAQYLLVGILRTMLLHQLHLHVVERIEIGKAVA